MSAGHESCRRTYTALYSIMVKPVEKSGVGWGGVGWGGVGWGRVGWTKCLIAGLVLTIY